jgi:RNA polymerase sigma factor (sigma-70 family)
MTEPSRTAIPSNDAFVATRWTLVRRANGGTEEARAALSELCDAYYRPVYRFLCREGRDEESARDLAQEFFMRLLQRGDVGGADRERGRFRSYLLGAVKHFLADQRKHARRVKRGAGAVHASLDAGETEDAPAMEVTDPGGPVMEIGFDREGALTVMERTLKAVEAEFSASAKGAQFEQLKPWLAGDASVLSQAEAARRLGMNEGAVKVAIHRLRKRFRELLRSEIAQTLADGGSIDDELRYLIEVLAR